jgi:hypothetical protein
MTRLLNVNHKIETQELFGIAQQGLQDKLLEIIVLLVLF